MSLTNSSSVYFIIICVSLAIAKPRTHLTQIDGDEVTLSCDLKTETEGMIVWKAGPRALFAGGYGWTGDFPWIIMIL